MLEKDVLITISSTQFSVSDESSEQSKTTASASYYLKDGRHYIIYDEIMEENMVSHNTLKISSSKVELIKKGAVSVKFEFEPEKRTLSSYNLPFGSLMLGVFTNMLEVLELEKSINVSVEYALDINDEHTSNCVIDISITNT